MSYPYEHLASNSRWIADNSYTSNALTGTIAKLVKQRGSLTKSLMALSDGSFKVNVVSEKIGKPYFHEQQKLQIPLQIWAKIRQVELQIHGEPVVFARSIIPFSLLQNAQSGLSNLGSNALGHLLFKEAQSNISSRDFQELSYQSQECYARRTPYKYLKNTVLVSEFFLPALNKFVKNNERL